MRSTIRLPLAWLSADELKKVQDVLRSLDVLHGVDAGFVDPAVHLLVTLWSRSREDHAADEVRTLQRDFLRDESADREAEEVHLGESQCVDERQRITSELLERRWLERPLRWHRTG
jgi:hypothetical protein